MEKNVRAKNDFFTAGEIFISTVLVLGHLSWSEKNLLTENIFGHKCFRSIRRKIFRSKITRPKKFRPETNSAEQTIGQN